MMIKSDELAIIGGRELADGQIRDDDKSERIKGLISKALVEVGHDSSGWDTLYMDPIDNRLWELTYPDSGLHGSGQPKLECISKAKADAKYDKS